MHLLFELKGFGYRGGGRARGWGAGRVGCRPANNGRHAWYWMQMHTSCVVEGVGGPCQPLCAERERKIMLVFQQPTVSFEILLVSRVAVGRTVGCVALPEAKTRVTVGAEPL